jgi:nitroreductase
MFNLLKNRRSIRKYTDEKVPEDVVSILLKSILTSPSGKNIQPWEIVYLNDEDKVSKLADAKAQGAEFLSAAKQCIVILADESKTDVWIEDVSIASTIAHLSAHALGLGSCWIQIRGRNTSDGISSEEYVRKIVGIPENIRVEAIIAFGYAAEEKRPKEEEKLKLEKVFANEYGKRYFD